MAFGSGVLISALSFELMDEAFRRGGLWPTAVGFLGGATVYTFANIWLSGAARSTASGRASGSRRRRRAAAIAVARCSTAFRNRS